MSIHKNHYGPADKTWDQMTEEEKIQARKEEFQDVADERTEEIENAILESEYSEWTADTDELKASRDEGETPLECSVREALEKRLNREFKPGFVKNINGGMVAIDFKDEQEFNQIKAMLAAK